MSNKVNAYKIPDEDLDEVKEIIKDGDGFKIIGQADFPTFLPESFTKNVIQPHRLFLEVLVIHQL